MELVIPSNERSNSAKEIYEKVLATFLAKLSRGECFGHSARWSHASETINKAFSGAVGHGKKESYLAVIHSGEETSG